MTVPTTILNDELLLRAFSVPSGLDEENRATPLVFRLRKKERDISLSRMMYYRLKDFLKKALSFKFDYLSLFDIPGGAVELLAGDVISIAPQHVVLKANPTKENPAHASIYYFLPDGTPYVRSKKTTDPTDPSILGYELALANAVRVVYDRNGNVLWRRTESNSV